MNKSLLFVSLVILLSGPWTVADNNNVNKADKLHQLTGVWQQYVLYDGQYTYLASFEVVKHKKGYKMPVRHLAPYAYIGPKGVHKMTFDGKVWQFHSDWSPRGTSIFKLCRKDANRYSGFAYLKGKKVQSCLWLRLKP